jgi:hypothetical protein
MKGWIIFKHATLMLWDNRNAVIRLTAVPFIATTALIVAYVAITSNLGLMTEQLYSGSPISAPPAVPLEQTGEYLRGLWGYLALSALVTLWVFVAWHRFVLLDEPPKGFIPALHAKRSLAYAGQFIKISLIAFLAILPIVAVFIGLIIAFEPLALVITQNPNLIAAGTVALIFLLVPFLTRIAMILPASAIGTPLKLQEAWRQTKGSTVTIFIAIILSAIVLFALQLVINLASGIPIFGFALSTFVSFVLGMLNASILTTLYGHYIENRSL